MTDAVRVVESEVRELIRRTGLDPARHPVEVGRLVHDVISDYDERSLHGGLPVLVDRQEAAKQVLDTVAGFGPLQPYFDDPTVEEIWINEPSKVFVARRGVAELTTTILTPDEVRDLVERMLEVLGPPRRPVLAVRRRDAPRRVAAARRHPRHHPRPLVRQHPQVRRPGRPPRRPGAARHPDRARRRGSSRRPWSPASTSSWPAARRPARPRCSTASPRRSPRGSGWSPARRSSSSRSRCRDVASMQCRQPSLEGTGEIPLRRLVKEALRMRPSRIIVGEVRQAESLDLLIALNSRRSRDVHHPRQLRPRGGHQDVHAAAAGRRERRLAVRRPDGRGVDRPRRPRRPSTATGVAPGARDRRRSRPGRGRRRRDRRPLRQPRRAAGPRRRLPAARRPVRARRLRPGSLLAQEI